MAKETLTYFNKLKALAKEKQVTVGIEKKAFTKEDEVSILEKIWNGPDFHGKTTFTEEEAEKFNSQVELMILQKKKELGLGPTASRTKDTNTEWFKVLNKKYRAGKKGQSPIAGWYAQWVKDGSVGDFEEVVKANSSNSNRG